MQKHVEVRMRKDSKNMQYNGRSWSAPFICPVCNRNIKKNLNFLGSKAVTCMGLRTFEKRLTVTEAASLQANLVEACGGSFQAAFPRLSALIDLGSIHAEGREYVGHAPDGPVGIGSIGDEERLENYLQQYPSPDRW